MSKDTASSLKETPLTPLFRRSLLALMLSLAGCGAAESGTSVPLSATHIYQSYDDRFTVAYPIDWMEVPRITLPVDTPFAAVSDDHQALLVVTKDYDTDVPALEAVLASARQDFGDQLKEASIVPFNGHQAVRLVADATVSGRPVRLLQYLVLDQSRLYNLTLRATTDAFDTQQPALEAIAASFKLKN